MDEGDKEGNGRVEQISGEPVPPKAFSGVTAEPEAVSVLSLKSLMDLIKKITRETVASSGIHLLETW